MTDDKRQALEQLWRDLNDCATNMGKWGRDRLLGMYADKLRAILDDPGPTQDDQPIAMRSLPSAEYDVPVEIIGVERPPMRFHIENGNGPPPPPQGVDPERLRAISGRFEAVTPTMDGREVSIFPDAQTYSVSVYTENAPIATVEAIREFVAHAYYDIQYLLHVLAAAKTVGLGVPTDA